MSFKHLAFKMEALKESSNAARKQGSMKLVKGHMQGKIYLSGQGLEILTKWSSRHE